MCPVFDQFTTFTSIEIADYIVLNAFICIIVFLSLNVKSDANNELKFL